MRRTQYFLLANSLLVAIVIATPATARAEAGPDGPSAVTTAPAAPTAAEMAEDENTNRSLASLAQKLAVAVSDREVRQAIHDAVGRRFDGDTDALWSSIAQDSAFNADVAAAASRGQVKKATAGQVADLARPFPKLQIAIPKNFDSWDPATYVPLVAFLPEGIDDTELQTITAYDAQGNPTLLDAKVPPKNPVIVLGMNERTDDSGNLLRSQLRVSSDSVASGPVSAAAATAYQVRMELVHLIDDKEPWPRGDAEISLKAKGDGCSFEYLDTNWEGLNNSGDTWQGPRVLGSTTCDVVFYWWEDDGGSFDFTLKWGGVDLGVHMDNGDDLIGGAEVPYAKFAGQGPPWDEREWSALYQLTD